MKENISNMLALIAQLSIEGKSFVRYLELGIRTGTTFNKVAPLVTEAYGVDINPDCYFSVSENKNLFWFNMVSRDFFEQLKEEKFDIIFIDADHTFKESYNDFKECSKIIKDDGLIFLHDTYPPDISYLEASACGWVYNTAWQIRNHWREDFEIVTLPVHCGLSVIRKSSKQLPWDPTSVEIR